MISLLGGGLTDLAATSPRSPPNSSSASAHSRGAVLNVELAGSLRVDLLARTRTELAHVEFVNDRRTDLHLRMVESWARILRRTAINALSVQTAERFRAMDRRFDQVDRRFDEVDRGFLEVRGKLDGVAAGLALIGAAIERIERRDGGNEE
ncbi:MAG: hypothetical protein ACT4QG_12130 [Sporichthyaceae bacterium]